MTIDELYEMQERIGRLHAKADEELSRADYTGYDITNARIRRLQDKYVSAIETYLDETDGPSPERR